MSEPMLGMKRGLAWAEDALQRRPALGWILAAAAACAAACLAPPELRDLGDWSRHADGFLLHGLSGAPDFRALPMAGVLAELQGNHLPAGFDFWFLFALRQLLVFCVFHLARSCSSSVGGVLAAALCCAVLPAKPEHLSYAILIVLAMGAAVRAERKPSWSSGAVAGLGLGVTLLFRSGLAFLPPLLSALLWGRSRRLALALLVGSYVLLLPWALLTRHDYGRVHLFEINRPDTKLLEAAMGLTCTTEADVLSFAGLAPGESVLGKAAQYVREDPGRYLTSIFRRAAFFFRIHPLLVLLALAAALWRWRSPPVRIAAAAAVYFVGIHCLLVAVCAAYFEPVWPLLAVLCATALPRQEDAGHDVSFAVLALPAALFAAFVVSLVALQPWRAEPFPAGIEKAAARFPRDAWLREQKGAWLLREGRTEEGLRDIAAAAAASKSPGDSRYAYAARVLAAATGKGPLPEPERPRPQDRLLQALVYVDSARDQEARLALDKARQAYESDAFIAYPALPYEERIQARLRAHAGKYALDLAQAMLFWPRDKRAGLAGRFQRLLSRNEELDFAQPLTLAYQDAGRYKPARALLTALCKERPSAGTLGDLGVLDFLVGDARAAVEHLNASLELDPASPERALSLGAVHVSRGEREKALEVYRRVLLRSPRRKTGAWKSLEEALSGLP